VDDGSQDDSFAVCSALAQNDERVYVYHHPNHANLGVSASRNLGIEQSRFPYIAFLDGDDYYLPNRFIHAETIFNQYPDADGVYDAVCTEFMNEASRQRWIEAGRDEALTTITQPLLPDALLDALLFDRHGAFHTNGITLKRDVFQRSGMFDPELRLHQDTALWLKISATSRLYGGEIVEPVAVRRVHLDNRISAKRDTETIYQANVLMAETVWRWAEANPNLSPDQKELFLEYYLRRAMAWREPSHSRIQAILKSRSLLLKRLLKHPQFSLKISFWRKLLPHRYY
jgi:glycosyltransferase involved in cell wall biosynthesis